MQTRWRTVDIIVATIIGLALGAVFFGWNRLWDSLTAFPLPWKAAIYGVWLVPAVLGGLVIRKPGAALYTEFIAALLSALLGSTWGLSVLLYGAVQGIAGEFGFAVRLYQSYRLVNALVSGALAGVAAALLDLNLYYGDFSTRDKVLYAALVIVSSTVVAGAGSWALQRALTGTGVLDRFPSGRERVAV